MNQASLRNALALFDSVHDDESFHGIFTAVRLFQNISQRYRMTQPDAAKMYFAGCLIVGM